MRLDAADIVQGCDFCVQQSPYWGRNERRFVDRIGAVSAGLDLFRCPRCATYYIYGIDVGTTAFRESG